MSRFNIAISSKFDELWRYNIVVVCELCSSEGERIEYKSQESFVAPVGSNLAEPPAAYDSNRTIKMTTEEGDYINLLLYVIPHTLPSDDQLDKCKPFRMIVNVEADKEQVLKRVFDINQWGGENISLEKLSVK